MIPNFITGKIIQQCEEDSNSGLDEIIWINPSRDGWTVDWQAWGMICKTEYPKTDAALVRLILRELSNKRTLSAWFKPEILDLDKRIAAAMIALELRG